MTPSLDQAIDRFGVCWRNRCVTVVGLGRSGMAAARLLRKLSCRVTVTEARTEATLPNEIKILSEIGITDVETGGHSPQSIEAAQYVVVSPGVSEITGPIVWAKKRAIPVISEIELAFLFCPASVVAITGTNGKSTAVTLVAEIVNATGRHAVACGNLGIPFSSVIPQLTERSIVVVEVSSFQLLHCERFRPHIAVLLNLGANHLDRHQDPQAYLSAKARLFQAQTNDDWAVLNARDPRFVELGGRLDSRCVWFGENRANANPLFLAEATVAALPDNLQAVLQVSRLLGIADCLAWQVIRQFRGLEHRMEPVSTVDGIRFVNDSKSTTPDSLLYALQRISGPVVAILGGRDKGLDFGMLLEPLQQERIKGIVLIGESRKRLSRFFETLANVRECATLKSAVEAAIAFAIPGSTVLFSPACASFDMFRDFEDRGRAFKALIRNLARKQQHEAVACAVNQAEPALCAGSAA